MTNLIFSTNSYDFNKDSVQLQVPTNEADAGDTLIIKRFRKLARFGWEVLVEYAQKCTVNGINYVFEPDRHWTERLWWLLALLLAIVGCGSMIQDEYDKWQETPVIVTFAEKATPVSDIPFPAVTVCPVSKSQTDLLNYTRAVHRVLAGEWSTLTETERQQIVALQQVCLPGILSAALPDVATDAEQADTDTITGIIRELAPKLNDSMQQCLFRQYTYECSKMFSEVITGEGLCFTFNMLNAKEMYKDNISPDFLVDDHIQSAGSWTLEGGYVFNPSEPDNLNIYPIRDFGSGKSVGLQFTLFQTNIEYLCHGAVQGYQVLLHAPDETPQLNHNFLQLPLDSSVLAAVKPQVMTTSQRVRDYPPERRQCLFSSERDLQFFRVYKRRSCELECLANYTLKTCGCVKFSMPRLASTPVCGYRKSECAWIARSDIQLLTYLDGLSGKPDTLGCNCLPECSSITYDWEISHGHGDFVKYMAAMNMTHDNITRTFMSIFFKDKQFIAVHRSELFGTTGFLANCGGLLGLFLGMSVLSVVEMVYFWSLRMVCNLRTKPTEPNGMGVENGKPSNGSMEMRDNRQPKCPRYTIVNPE